MHILFAAVCSSGADDCTLNFASSLLDFLNTIDNVNKVTVNFLNDVNKALDMFARGKEFDRLILCNTRMTASREFLKAALASDYPFISGVYPLTTMDWGTAEKGNDKEDVAYRGLTYNVDPQSASKRDGDYILLEETTMAAVVLTRQVVESIMARCADDVCGEPEHMFYTSRIKQGKTVSKDANFCQMWGGTVAADIEHPLSLSGPMAFAGCIGQRNQLR